MKNRLSILFVVSLMAALPMYAEGPVKDSLVNMPWQNQLSVDKLTSGVQQVMEQDLEHSSVSDIRRRLRGLFLSAQVLENCGGLGQSGVMTSPFMGSDQISTPSRCFWNLACIIDDVPVPMNQYLIDPNQIESITLITDIFDKSSYGPVASNGAYYIRTKRGGYNTPLRITVDVESGIETPSIWPEYVNGEQYAVLNNIAREQSGYLPLFTKEDIKGIAAGGPNDLKYPNVDYRSTFYRNYKPVSRFAFNATAGSEKIKYNVSMNGLYGSDLIKIGPQSYTSKINVSSSITARMGRYVETNVAFNGLLTFAQDGHGGGFWETNSISPVAFPLILTVTPDSEYYDPNTMGSGMTMYGVSRTVADNPYAAQIEGGYSRTKRRSGMVSTTVNFDMSWLLPGLKSKTFASLSTFYSSTIGKNEEYLAYYWDRNTVLDGRSVTHTGAKEAQEALLGNSTFQSFNAFQRFTYDWSRSGHEINAAATGWITNAATSGKNAPVRLLSGIAALKYSYADRYVVDMALNTSGCALFKGKSRVGYFPSAGIAWNLHNEPFMQNVPWLNRFKLRAQYGKVGDLDIYGAEDNMWESVYSNSVSTYYHFGPQTGTSWIGSLIEYLSTCTLRRYGNDELTWPVITEIDAGFDATLFKGLDVKFNYYKAVQSGVIVNVSEDLSVSLGHIAGGGATHSTNPMALNHDQYTYKGYELGVAWHQDWRDFGYNIGIEGRNWDKVNDIVTNNLYKEEYQNAAGRHASEWRGYVYEGIFKTQEEIDSSPLMSTETRIGDIKYKDVNGDGKIDANDKVYISNGNAKLRYSLHVGFRYKDFDFFMLGTGQAGYKVCLTGTYFMGGYGITNYSKFIWDNLYRDADGNPTAYGENFPRLCYIYNNNNFECSEYWLRNGGWFKIQTAELGYTLPLKHAKGIKGLRLSLRGSNLLTFTGLEYIDPEANVAGIQAAPLYRAYTVGAKFTF